MGLFKTAVGAIRRGLTRTRASVGGAITRVVAGREVDDAAIEQIEAILLTSDLGVAATASVIDELRREARAGRVRRGEDAIDVLRRGLESRLERPDRELRFADAPPTVILVAGVNGSGKTTSVAKIAKSLRDEGRSVLLAAADTYRAGAVAQLETWAGRLGVEVIKGTTGADPAAVVFDATEAALRRRADVLLIDTAGRLHTQDNLMRQLTKIRDVTAKKVPGAPHEVLLVLDATAGQNSLAQARLFTAAIGVTGIFLAKLDGTAKGGVVVAVQDALGIPVKLIGVGETPDDVERFDPAKFVDGML